MNITYLNLICSALGGTTTHKYEINALNEWCTLLGGIGGHKYNNKALNELVTLYGGSTTYPYDIEAYNAILVLLGETGGYKYLKDALIALSGAEVNNLLPTLNLIIVDLEGVEQTTKLAALNEICTLVGGVGNHATTLDAVNELCTLYSAETTLVEFTSLQNLYIALGGVGSFTTEYGYWNAIQQGGLLNVFDELAPSNVITSVASATQIDLAWTVNSENADGHKVYISTDNTTFTLKGTVEGATAAYSATELTADTIYYFQVKAYKSDKLSAAAIASNMTVLSVGIGLNSWNNKHFNGIVTPMGNEIPYVEVGADWMALTTPGYCYSNGSATTRSNYGLLFNYYAFKLLADDIQAYNALHPDSYFGYKCPDYLEWQNLITNAGGLAAAGISMKEVGNTYWLANNAGTTNSTGFSARGAAVRNGATGNYSSHRVLNAIWCLREVDSGNAYHYDLRDSQDDIKEHGYYLDGSKKHGLSIRLIKYVNDSVHIGASNSTNANGTLPQDTYLLTTEERHRGNFCTNIAVAGNTCVAQKTAFLALTNKTKYRYVSILVGLNNLVSGQTAEQCIAELQDLVTTVKANINANCKIILCTVTPIGATGALLTKMNAYNEAIMGLGATPITSVDARIDLYNSAINDGNNNIKAEYEIVGLNDHTHYNNDAKVIVGAAIRTAVDSFSIIK